MTVTALFFSLVFLHVCNMAAVWYKSECCRYIFFSRCVRPLQRDLATLKRTWWLHICCRQCLMPAPRVTQFGQWLLVKHDFQEPCCTFYFFIFFCCCSCQLSGRCDSRCLTIIKHGCIITIIITIIIYSIELENWIPKRPRLKSCQSSQGDTAQCCSPGKNISKMPVFMTRNG